MGYKKVEDRRQYTMFPDCIDDYIGSESPCRVFDLFIDRLDMAKPGFERSTPTVEGRPGYDPRDLLKLYVYGYFYGIRSSRKLERECKCNIEVMWLLNRLTPDFRTISDFRKDNKKAITDTFRAFNRRCIDMSLFSKAFISIDGSKFKACNSKDRNFTLGKIDDRISRLEMHIDEYMKDLDECDAAEGSAHLLDREELERKIAMYKERKELYEGYRAYMEEHGLSQLSLTDPDAKLMKTGDGFGVCYNIQTGVDARSHLIGGFEVTDHPTDHGFITSVASEIKSDYQTDIIESVADKGYEEKEDMARALCSGIIPNVILPNGKRDIILEVDHTERMIPEEQRLSTDSEDIRQCLEAGVIPAVYDNILSDVTTVEKRQYERGSTSNDGEVSGKNGDEMRRMAIEERCFVRDIGRSLVYCPSGFTLRVKSVKPNGSIRYENKLACKRCNKTCTLSRHMSVTFSKNQNVSRQLGSRYGKPYHDKSAKLTIRKVVRYRFHPDFAKLNERKCLSEHPFGTIKRSLGATYFLLRGKEKVEAEMALLCMSYNLHRTINMIGVKGLLEGIVAA